MINTMNPFDVDVKPRNLERVEWVKKHWEEQKSALLDENEQWVRSPELIESVMQRAAR